MILIFESNSSCTSNCHPWALKWGFVQVLGELLGNLFLIDKLVDLNLQFHIEDSDVGGKTPSFRSLQLNEEKSKWISVKGLGDQMMFVGDGFCYSISARDFVGLNKNYIYFNDTCFSGFKDDSLGWAAGLFDLKDDVSQPLESAIGYLKFSGHHHPGWGKDQVESKSIIFYHHYLVQLL